MVNISEKDFETMASSAIDSLPKQYIDNMDNVAIVVEEDPTEEQLARMHVLNNQLLYGLYEGIPLTARSNSYNLVPPDKITIFKNPICQNSTDIENLKEQIKRTIWHEIAHHYGLNHEQMDKLQNHKSK
jgi:predicted Zn-dependent protease with MMP-like domain